MFQVVSGGNLHWVERDGARVSARFPFVQLATARMAVLEAEAEYSRIASELNPAE